MANLKDVMSKLATPMAEKAMEATKREEPRMGHLIEILADRGELGKLTHLAALSAIAERATATDTAAKRVSAEPNPESTPAVKPSGVRGFFHNVQGVYKDFLNVLSEERVDEDSMDGKGFRLAEALAHLLEHEPEALSRLLRDGVDYRVMIDNPLDPTLGSPVEIMAILAMHRPSKWASFQDWKDRAVNMPELRRVAKEQSVFLAMLVTMLAVVALVVTAPELLRKLVTSLAEVLLAPLRWLAYQAYGVSITVLTIAMALWAVEDLFLGWGLAETASLGGTLKFLWELESADAMSPTAMAVGLGVWYVARILTGEVDRYFFGEQEEETPAKTSGQGVGDLLRRTFVRPWMGLGYDDQATTPGTSNLSAEERERMEERNLVNFKFSKFRRVGLTLSLVISILQIGFLGKWLVENGALTSWAGYMVWSAGMVTTWLGAEAEFGARFPGIFDSKAKAAMLLKAFEKIERWGLRTSVIMAIGCFSLGMMSLLFLSSSVGQLVVNSTEYTIQVATDTLSDVAVKNGYTRSKDGSYTRVTNPGQGQMEPARSFTSPQASGHRLALCGRPENADLFVCQTK